MFNIDEIYTVSSFLSLCNKTIENNIPTCWLSGEISNLSRPASGHWYFSLKDDKGQIRCALFRLNQRNVKFNPENGMQILVRAAPTLYEARGDFQIIIQHIEPVGVGNLNLAFEQLKEKLTNEGLFADEHKKSLPLKPNTIGVISSSNGAVIRDIVKILNKRYPFAKILLFDSIVQGDNAAKKLTTALNVADKSNKCDVIIIARGGGSLEDLWAFNEEILARAIFDSTTPIVSAVGHETDVTIADFVADVRAPTPSAAAMLVAPDRLDLLSNSAKLYKQLLQQQQQIIQQNKNALTQLKLRIPSPDRQLNLLAQRLDYLNSNLKHQAKNIINLNANKLNSLSASIKQHSPIENIRHSKELNRISINQLNQQIRNIVSKNTQRLEYSSNKLLKAINILVDKNKNQLSIYVNSLEHLSPLSTLSRGYSITTNAKNQVLSSMTDIKINQTITTRLTNGKIHSKIEKIDED